MNGGDSWAEKLPLIKSLAASGQFDEIVAASPFVQKLVERLAVSEGALAALDGTLKQVVAHLQQAAQNPPAAGTGTPEALGMQLLATLLQGAARPASDHNPLGDLMKTLQLLNEITGNQVKHMVDLARYVKAEPAAAPEREAPARAPVVVRTGPHLQEAA